MSQITVISPKKALRRAGREIPDFVITLINGMLVTAAKEKSPDAIKLCIKKSTLRMRIADLCSRNDVSTYDTHWEDFPFLYAGKWDIQIPPSTSDSGYYIFTPKGCSGG